MRHLPEGHKEVRERRPRRADPSQRVGGQSGAGTVGPTLRGSSRRPLDRRSADLGLPFPIRVSRQGDRDHLHRIIVVSPTRTGESYLTGVFESASLAIQPAVLETFEGDADSWCDEYVSRHPNASLVEINLVTAVYWFDRTDERVVVAYGISTRPQKPHDLSRMRRFPDVSIGVNRVMGDMAFPVDRGHFISHAAGGELDINLFPQRRELNRGWSEEGKLYRKMERLAAHHPGTFHFHRARYDDDTWIPSTLQYGVLRENETWWVEDFENKSSRQMQSGTTLDVCQKSRGEDR